jgi:hypothetical protein
LRATLRHYSPCEQMFPRLRLQVQGQHHPSEGLAFFNRCFGVFCDGADRISEIGVRHLGCTPIPRRIDKLYRQLEGWANYFSLGYPREAYRSINRHTSWQPAPLPDIGGDVAVRTLKRLGLKFLRVKTCESR